MRNPTRDYNLLPLISTLRTGPLATMLTASVSIPAALPPVLWKGDLLTDGGTFNKDVMRDCGAA